MPDDPFSGSDSQQDEFFRGLNFLGRPSSITLPGQEPTSPGGLSAGAPTPSAPSPTGAPADTAGMMGGGGSSGLNALMTALSFANRGSNVLDLVSQGFGAATGGAVQTPSGQLTTGAPEILRGLQFPEGNLSMAEQAFATQAEQGGDIAGQAASNLGLGSYLGTALGAAPSILSIIQALQAGDPAGIINPLGQLGLLGASVFDLIPTAASVAGGEAGGAAAGGIAGGLAGAAGAALPIGAGVTILTNIIADMIRDPQGQRSMAENYRYLMSQQVPQEAGILGLAASALPLINDSLSNEQALQLYDLVRLGVEAPGQLADPMAQAGRTEHGVQYPSLPGLSESVQQEGPAAWQALMRLEDLMSRRGIQPPTVEGALGRMSPDIIQWQLGELTHPQFDVPEGTIPAGAWYGRPASETAFLEPLGPIDFSQGPYAGYAAGGAEAGSPFVPAPSAAGAADALPASMGSGTVFPWESA